MEQGKVWLVGAGPGDIGLLTLKGFEVLQEAQVVVYDALVSDEIAALIPKTAKKINVGKRANNHLVKQEDTNRILLEEALAGKRVVRLKGGDPFVFGRGGEELELLVERDIPYEIVPGITSAVSVPAYAGIPVTHRDYSSSVHIITGHTRKGRESRIQYDALVKMNATLIFLMGIGVLEEICNSLMAAGMDPDTKAAVLEKGTSAKQRRVIATVGTLKIEADKAKVQTPAIIVVGEVCGLADSFAWVEKQVLSGLQIVVTRPRQKASSLTKKLRNLGAHVIEMPAISTRTLEEEEVRKTFKESIEGIRQRLERAALMEEYEKTQVDWQQQDRQLQDTQEWIVFTSPKGVESFFLLLASCQLDIRVLYCKNVSFAVIGDATRKELRNHGIEADYMPDTYCGEALGKGLIPLLSKNSNVTLYRARNGTEDICEVLSNNKVAYNDVAVYCTEYELDDELSNRVKEGIENQLIDYVTFTSASSVTAFIACQKELDYTRVNAICIGEQTAAVAKKYNMNVVVSKAATIDSMIETLEELNIGN
ncbi:uroporphyrinogen-III C-methyltransferase [Anaerosporobacter faecicola]|uniref:uroporphyrinogen-III C-methyltransferase n=1 Tax=Anaerosporobacter faecicola TaxID=2718714 RepID=UPI00143B2978|nr:uroporphyrinogen-III C-methyltransferase [Anaerosporobacter faecicola]